MLDIGHTKTILEVCKKHGLSKRDTSYVLATAWWETARTVEPVREAYYLGSKAETYRKTLRYYPWYGRGFVQLTWKENYDKAAKRLRLTSWSADTFLQPDIAAEVLVLGMKEGWFTGKKLSDYKTHYSSRAIVNGDKDKLSGGKKIGLIIEDKAKEYLQALESQSNSNTGVAPAPTPNQNQPEESRSVITLIIEFLMRLFR